MAAAPNCPVNSAKIDTDLGGYDAFKKKFVEAGMTSVRFRLGVARAG